MYHVPVLLSQCIDGLKINPQGIYVDVTFGGGGHSRAIVEQLTTGKLYAFDRDPDAHKNAWNDDRLVMVQQNYRYIKNALRFLGVRKVDGILADLGVSSFQLDEQSRGFTLQDDARLDMRMNQATGITAAEVLNTYEEAQLADVFYQYGEIKKSRRLAAAIVAARAESKFKVARQLKAVAKSIGWERSEHQFYARVFQALRIEVNQELESLMQFLEDATDMLAEGGRLVVMSYHSLEDRLVKNYMKTGVFNGRPEVDLYGAFDKPLKMLSSKALLADDDEIARNSRASSVRLRIAEK